MRHLRHILTEPREALFTYRGRLFCRLFRYHGLTCRGRMDHWPRSSVRGRWHRPNTRWKV